MSRVSGNTSLNFTAGMDIRKFKMNAAEVRKEVADLKKYLTEGLAVKPIDTKPISAYREAQLRMQESLKSARLETERLKKPLMQPWEITGVTLVIINQPCRASVVNLLAWRLDIYLQALHFSTFLKLRWSFKGLRPH
jgi:hypothetical protein